MGIKLTGIEGVAKQKYGASSELDYIKLKSFALDNISKRIVNTVVGLKEKEVPHNDIVEKVRELLEDSNSNN